MSSIEKKGGIMGIPRNKLSAKKRREMKAKELARRRKEQEEGVEKDNNVGKQRRRERLIESGLSFARSQSSMAKDAEDDVRKMLADLDLDNLSEDEVKAAARAHIEGGVTKSAKLIKTDASKMIVGGVVYAPDEVDSQGDFATQEEIEAAAHRFLANGFVGRIDVEHNQQPTDARVVESFIAKSGDPHFPEGSWAVSVKLTEPLWQDVTVGRLNGFSFFGDGKRKKVQKNGKTLNELHDIKISLISLVKNGANRTDFAITKTDKPARKPLLNPGTGGNMSKKTSAVVKAAVRGVENAVSKLEQPAVSKAERERIEKRQLRINELTDKLQILNSRLHSLWASASPGRNLRELEAQLLIEIERAESELTGIQKSDDLLCDRRSAFAHRGGQSVAVTIQDRADLNSALGVQNPHLAEKAVGNLQKSALGSNSDDSEDDSSDPGKVYL